jgi:cyclopropane fatty-acyl-phospholipid synthase-like methyltransferase
LGSRQEDVAIVAAKTAKDDVQWIFDFCGKLYHCVTKKYYVYSCAYVRTRATTTEAYS